MWSHMQSIMFPTDEALCSYMQQNRDFANRHSLPLETGYAVSPHHAGVYPVHEPLYHCWREIWGVTVTSTEEYPHLRPDRLRRGFIHQVYSRELSKKAFRLINSGSSCPPSANMRSFHPYFILRQVSRWTIKA